MDERNLTKAELSKLKADTLKPPSYGATSDRGPQGEAEPKANSQEGIVKRALLSFADAPEYNQDNPSILTGYRHPTNSWAACVESIGHWHNETINIHSHLWPSLFALSALLLGLLTLSGTFDLLPPPASELRRAGWKAIIRPVYPFSTPELPSVGLADSLVFGVFAAGAAVCFAASTVFHTSLCHSPAVVDRTRRLDFLGIFLMGNACFVPSFHYGFFCDTHLFKVYTAMMTVACFTGIYIVCLSDAFQTPAYRRLRTATFVLVGSMSVFPFVHAISLYGWEEASASMGLGWIGIEMMCYVLGAVVYAERCPERVAPGRFDLVGASHQIFHVLAVLAIAAQYASAGEGFRYRHGEQGGVCFA